MPVSSPPISASWKAREITREYGALLVFDEVMTGFRISYGGAQARHITPDHHHGQGHRRRLPGRLRRPQDIMEMVAPAAPMYQAGTPSGNPLAMTAGIKTGLLKRPGTYEKLEATTKRL